MGKMISFSADDQTLQCLEMLKKRYISHPNVSMIIREAICGYALSKGMDGSGATKNLDGPGRGAELEADYVITREDLRAAVGAERLPKAELEKRLLAAGCRDLIWRPTSVGGVWQGSRRPLAYLDEPEEEEEDF